MGVPNQAKPDHVLEAFHEGSESNTKLMLAVEGRVMAHHDSEAALCLNLHELLLKPGELVTGIVALAPSVEVECVASVSVVGDEARALGQAFTILESGYVHRVVTVLAVFCLGLFVEPVTPELLNMVNAIVRVGGGEVLLVHRPSVMVTMDGQNSDISVLSSGFNDVRDSLSVACDLFKSVRPDVVR